MQWLWLLVPYYLGILIIYGIAHYNNDPDHLCHHSYTSINEDHEIVLCPGVFWLSALWPVLAPFAILGLLVLIPIVGLRELIPNVKKRREKKLLMEKLKQPPEDSLESQFKTIGSK